MLVLLLSRWDVAIVELGVSDRVEHIDGSIYTHEIRNIQGSVYRGRRLIGRDTDIRGGVLYGRYAATEALVVDPDKNPDVYWDYFKKACDMARDDSGDIDPSYIVGAVFDTVKANMAYSEKGVRQIRQEFGSAHGQEIELGRFMRAGVGVCRHQALACAALLEDFRELGIIHGEISVERNVRWNPTNSRKGDGHAWTRYTTTDGNAYILDVAQDFFGTLDESQDVAQWDYLRTEEVYERYIAIQQKLGKTGVRGFFNRVGWLLTGK